MSGADRHSRASQIFLAACDLPPGDQLPYVDAQCGEDQELRDAVRELLRFDATDAVVDDPVPPMSFLDADPPRRIGPFAIEGVLGEGGMGMVYRARQENPSRMVAVKVVRPERATPELLRRFEYEAHALARLHHPAIAQIFEAGSVDTGRGCQPYFAMELVDGVPLPRFAEQRGLSAEARLDLLARVCDGVQHAHQNGVIHRDLKPGNVLVDANGDPKILDFGVARIADSDPATTTLRTTAGQLLGTIAYMSPEQARGDPSAIDARSDVYALGVMAYELLAGHLPLELERRPLPEAARAICEEEPTRLGATDTGLRGDIETIVATAMAKDSAARYQSADALAADIRRCLADQPILARPASAMYQLRKFARRNRTLVASAVAMTILLVTATIVSTALAIGQSRARDAATRSAERADLVRGFFLRVFVAAAPEQAGPDVTVAEALRRAQVELETALPDLPEVRADIHHEMALTFVRLTIHDDAERHAREALRLRTELHGPDHTDVVLEKVTLASVLLGRLGDAPAWDEAEALLDEALLKAHDDAELRARIVSQQAVAAFRRDDDQRAESLTREAMVLAFEREGPTSETAMRQRQNLAMLLSRRGDHADAARELEALLDARRVVAGARHPSTLQLHRELAGAYRAAGELTRAEAIYRELMPIQEAVSGPEHDATVIVVNELAFCLKAQSRFDESAAYYRDALDRVRRGPTPDGFLTIIIADSLALTLTQLEEFEQAAVLHLECIDRFIRFFPEHDRGVADSRFKHADVVLRGGDTATALALTRTAITNVLEVFPAEDRSVVNLRAAHARALAATGSRSAAERLTDECAAAYARLTDPDWLCRRSAEMMIADREAAGDHERAAQWRGILEGMTPDA